MPEISFYESVLPPFEKTISQLLAKCYETSMNTLVKCKDEEMQDLIDRNLWTFSQKLYVPHAKNTDDFPENQPVLISLIEENLNNSKILFLVACDYSDLELIKEFDRVIVIFDQSSDSQRQICREYYKKLKQNFSLKYYKQSEKGNWQEM
jgi:DNA polymerase III subunit chi